MKKLSLENLAKLTYTFFILTISAIALITLLSAFGIPKSAQIFAVETGSMEPNIPTGSVVFVSPQQSYQVGDVITYKSNLGKNEGKNYNVTHRVSGIISDNGDTFYDTKGDANSAPDPWKANKIDVIGKVNAHLPYIGYIVSFAKTKIGFTILIMTPALIIIILEIINIINILREKAPKFERKISGKGLYIEL